MTAGGMVFEILSPKAGGNPITRAESRTAALALIELYVTICATRSSPYFWVA